MRMMFTLSCIQGLLGRLLQTENELGAALWPVRCGQVSPQLPRDTDRNHQSQTEALTGFLGREERLEQSRPVMLRDSRAVVTHRDLHPVADHGHSDHHPRL